MDAEQQKDLHEASLAEVSKGHLHGPLEEHQVSAALGSDQWLFSPRFAVYQGEEKKVRPIDDCKRSGLNCAYSVNFKLELLDVDSLACLFGCSCGGVQQRQLRVQTVRWFFDRLQAASFSFFGRMGWANIGLEQSLQAAGN